MRTVQEAGEWYSVEMLEERNGPASNGRNTCGGMRPAHEWVESVTQNNETGFLLVYYGSRLCKDGEALSRLSGAW